jgi:ParB-like chromosome segregation protein Spo0J
MPPVLVYEDPGGILEIVDGVTRATRIAKLAPGQTVPVIIIGRYRRSRAGSPCIKDRL